MNIERKSKNIIIGLLCAIIVMMGIGFSLLRSELEISGGASLSNTWNVRITNIEVLNASANANAGPPYFNATSVTDLINLNVLLGDAFKRDTASTNNSYPILFWQ